jgi:hypothetical protein
MTGRGIGNRVARSGNDIDTLKQMTDAVAGVLNTISAGEIIALEYSPTP